jgi:CO/xanthine dehydrogenase FAD-binding subunit
MASETLIPGSADEAARLFGDGDGVTVFGGGTILMPQIAAGYVRPARALLLHRSGLAGIERDGGTTRIGAMTPISALAEGDGLLARLAGEIADR